VLSGDKEKRETAHSFVDKKTGILGRNLFRDGPPKIDKCLTVTINRVSTLYIQRSFHFSYVDQQNGSESIFRKRTHDELDTRNPHYFSHATSPSIRPFPIQKWAPPASTNAKFCALHKMVIRQRVIFFVCGPIHGVQKYSLSTPQLFSAGTAAKSWK